MHLLAAGLRLVHKRKHRTVPRFDRPDRGGLAGVLLLGIFIGTPRTEASLTAPSWDLDRVMIFKKNLEKVCPDPEELIDQIGITVRHEIGHYLGLDEDDMERLGLA